MVHTLRVDTAGLDEAARNLRVISAEFKEADDFADRLGVDVGHAGLAERLRSFAEGWRIRRGEIEKQVSKLAETLEMTSSSFRESDSGLAESLEGSQGSCGVERGAGG